MSSYADVDSTCVSCGGECDFTTESLQGHAKKHRTSTCRDCKEWMLLVDCIGC